MDKNEEKLLSRAAFREQTLSRNHGICCVPSCSVPAVDAHHILNRNLFREPEELGGYFFSNGAQLCSVHHYRAELTLISVEQLRSWCKVTPKIPQALSTEKNYDCWGNEILSDGQRVAGMLFNDDGFQKILKTVQLGWLFQNSQLEGARDEL